MMYCICKMYKQTISYMWNINLIVSSFKNIKDKNAIQSVIPHTEKILHSKLYIVQQNTFSIAPQRLANALLIYLV